MGGETQRICRIRRNKSFNPLWALGTALERADPPLRAHQAGGCPHCERSGAWTLAANLGQGEGRQYMTRTFFVMQQGKAGAHNHVAKRDQGWCIGKSEISQ